MSLFRCSYSSRCASRLGGDKKPVSGEAEGYPCDFRWARVWSHCLETEVRYCCKSCSGSGSKRKSRSRPDAVLLTIPARSRTPRCFVIAWRVSLESSASCEIEAGSPEQSRATKARRVLSPSAANTRALALGLAVMRFRIFRDIAPDDRTDRRMEATSRLHI